ncbi:MAG: PfkB family carbohydrate kinase [Synechococcus sp.]|nr:PfkB family carbohydrate kinase [Synechococcus sp.]
MPAADPNVQQPLSTLKVAVIGHQEWVNFLQVDRFPQPGQISRSLRSLEEPAGAGAVVAVQLARLTGQRVPFFTALGRDDRGEQSVARLQELGVDPLVAWRDAPSRRGISLVDGGGDRAITVIGERHTPLAEDPLPWDLLQTCDGVFVSATDASGLKLARQARILTATPRLGLSVLEAASVPLDALIGSALDPSEQVAEGHLNPPPRLTIATEGDQGGWMTPGGRYQATEPPGLPLESYGCGDSFAAGVTAGLAAGWPPAEAVRLGAKCGALCVTRFGPY